MYTTIGYRLRKESLIHAFGEVINYFKYCQVGRYRYNQTFLFPLELQASSAEMLPSVLNTFFMFDCFIKCKTTHNSYLKF